MSVNSRTAAIGTASNSTTLMMHWKQYSYTVGIFQCCLSIVEMTHFLEEKLEPSVSSKNWVILVYEHQMSVILNNADYQ